MGITLPSESLLSSISFETSVGKSTNKLAITDEIVSIVETDAQVYETVVGNIKWLRNYCCRVKTPDSIRRKVSSHPNLRFQSVFNDILGLRLKVDEYPGYYPNYFRVVDMRNGKATDDGYRAIHLYYKKSNYHYSIEIQLWSSNDYDFNSWTHMHAYKSLENDKLLKLRQLYDSKKIKSEYDFIEEVNKLCQK